MLTDLSIIKSDTRQKGFTLIEILVAIAILGIMAAAFLPILSSSMSNIFRPGYQEQALYQAQTELDNFTGSTDPPDKVEIGSTTIKGTLKTATKTVSGYTVSLYYFYVP